MRKLEENLKSEAQLKLLEKLERDKKKLQEQVKKDHDRVEELKKQAKSSIGDLFIKHLPDFYNFDPDELSEIIDTAMKQKATRDKIAAIRKKAEASSEEYAGETEDDYDEESDDETDGIYGGVEEDSEERDV